LGAVFHSLVGNAVSAADEGGRVTISTRSMDSQVEIRIEDTGRGIPADRLATIFEPSFRLAGNRVSIEKRFSMCRY